MEDNGLTKRFNKILILLSKILTPLNISSRLAVMAPPSSKVLSIPCWRLALVIVFSALGCLTDGDRQDRFPVELRGIQIVLDELEFLQELILLEIGVEVVQRHAELLVHLALVLVLRLDAVVVLMLYDFLDRGCPCGNISRA